MVRWQRVLLPRELWQQHRLFRFTDGVLLLENGLKPNKSRPVVERPLEGTSTDSMLHTAWASCGWSLVTPEFLGLFSNVLSQVAVCQSVSPPHRGCV